MPHHYMMPSPKRGISAVLIGLAVSAATLGAVVGLELAAPFGWKPSSVFGDYNGRLAAEIKAHDLETQAQYENWAQRAQLSVTPKKVWPTVPNISSNSSSRALARTRGLGAPCPA